MQPCYYAWSTTFCWINNILIFLLNVSFVCCASSSCTSVINCGKFHTVVITVCVMGEDKMLGCVKTQSPTKVPLKVIVRSASDSSLFSKVVSFPILIFSMCVCAVSRLWKWRRSWAGVQDGDHTALNPAKQKLYPTAAPSEKTRTGGERGVLRWSTLQVLYMCQLLYTDSSLPATNSLIHIY